MSIWTTWGVFSHMWVFGSGTLGWSLFHTEKFRFIQYFISKCSCCGPIAEKDVIIKLPGPFPMLLDYLTIRNLPFAQFETELLKTARDLGCHDERIWLFMGDSMYRTKKWVHIGPTHTYTWLVVESFPPINSPSGVVEQLYVTVSRTLTRSWHSVSMKSCTDVL